MNRKSESERKKIIEYNRKYRQTNNWKNLKKIYDKGYKRKTRRQRYMSALNDERMYGEFHSTDEVFDNLLMPVPVFSQEMENIYNEGKYASLFKKSSHKILFAFLKAYFAYNHDNYEDVMFLGVHEDLMKQFSSNKYEKMFDLFLIKIPGIASEDKYKRRPNGYMYKYQLDWNFLSYENANKYMELLSYQKFDEAREFYKKRSTKSYNATTVRMSLLLKRDYKINDITKKDFVSEINTCYLRKIAIEKPFVDESLMSKIAQRTFEKDKTTKEEFVKTIKNTKQLTLEDVLINYIKVQKKKKEKYEIGLEHYTRTEVIEGVERHLRQTIRKINDAEKILNNIQDNYIITEELNDKGREYNLFTQVSKEVRELVFVFLGFTYEIDLTFSGIQLFIENEKKWFKTSSLELLYNKTDDLALEVAQDIKVENGNTKVMLKKAKKQLKRYFTFIMNGGYYENLPYYLKDRVSEEIKSKIINYGKAISNTYIKFKSFFVDNKLDFIKKDNKKVNEDNIVFYEYTLKEKRVIKELSKILEMPSFRVHDALYVKAVDIAFINEKLKEFNYDVKVTKITSKLLNYI